MTVYLFKRINFAAPLLHDSQISGPTAKDNLRIGMPVMQESHGSMT